MFHYTHGPEEGILRAGALAHCMNITGHGSYRLQPTKPDETPFVFSETRYVGELALVADMGIVATTGTTLLLASIYALSGADLVSCVQALPGASNFMDKYAGTLLECVSNPGDKVEMREEWSSELIQAACVSTRSCNRLVRGGKMGIEYLAEFARTLDRKGGRQRYGEAADKPYLRA